MKKQIYNPYLPCNEYIPDGEPRIFNNRLYIFGSHDKFNGKRFCDDDYVTYSCDINDLTSWRYEGIIFKKEDVYPYFNKKHAMWAPDVVQGKDENYYLYSFVDSKRNTIFVAKSDKPNGLYKYLDEIHFKDGTIAGINKKDLKLFDPGVIVEEDAVYLFSGFAPRKNNIFVQHGHKATHLGPQLFILEHDMVTIKEGPIQIDMPGRGYAKGTSFEGHEFFEASSIRKFNDIYYFIYSSANGHELCYATSKNIKGPYIFKGTLISIGDIGINGNVDYSTSKDYLGNTHGSIAKINDEYYVFAHRQTNQHCFSRQAIAEKIYMDENGEFKQAERTSCGLNNGPLIGKGIYETRIACNLYTDKGTYFYGVLKNKFLRRQHPYFTQDKQGKQFIKNLRNGSHVGFKYFKFDGSESLITINAKGNFKGKILVKDSEGNLISNIIIDKNNREHKSFFKIGNKISGLFFEFLGKGKLDLYSFEIL